MPVKVELDIRAQIKNLNKGLDKTQKELKQLQTQSNKTSRTMQKNMNKTSQVAKKLSGALLAVFSIGAVVRLGREMINTRKEFETFRAVLANTLGSTQAANREFAKIQEFAKATPFQVRELTDSFVRLVNQGFKPTMKQMTLLGDLASSTGKSFIQLSEAIIDAQVGEFERLKEFGIRANKEGDKVTFTFKEVETQVDFTAQAIQGYILSLGEVEGVTGAMVAISATLEGRLSELEDSWDDLMDVMGGKSVGIIVGAVGLMSDLSSGIADLLRVLDPEIGAQAALEDFREELANWEKEDRAGFVIFKIGKLRDELIALSIAIDARDVKDIGGMKVAENLQESLRIQIGLYTELVNEINAGTDGIDDLNDKEEVEIETIETLQKKIKGLIEDKKILNTSDTEGIAIKNREIAAIKEQIEELNKLGVVLEPKDITVSTEEERNMQMELDKEYYDFIAEQEKERAETAKATNALITANLEEDLNKRILLQEIEAQARVDTIFAGLDLLQAVTKDNAVAQQIIAISQAIINGALAITKVQAQTGVLSPPFIIATALTTLAQIATIRSQKFAGGHYEVLKGARHSQGGVDIGIGEAEGGEGIAVFSQHATKKYGKFLPAFVKAINENKADVTENGSYAFNFDDSRSVSELKVISALLSKPDVRYENGYRIETRNGQRTRIKV